MRCGCSFLFSSLPAFWIMHFVSLTGLDGELRGIAVDLASLGKLLTTLQARRGASQAKRTMELRTSISSVLCARNEFASHIPRKWAMQRSTQPSQHALRCTCAAPKPDVQESQPVLRRSVVSLMSTLLVAAATSSVGAKPMMPMMVEPDLPRFRKTPSGVRIQEVVDGAGPEAKTGDTLEFDFVCRRSNGYFVYSTVDQFNDQSRPAVLPLGTGKMIPGLEEVLAGMRPGGKRRALIPPEVGYTDTSLEPLPLEFGPRRALMSHAKEPLVFEVQLLKIK